MSVEEVKEKQLDLEEAVKRYQQSGNQDDREKILSLGKSLADYFAGIYSPGNVDMSIRKSATEGFQKALKNYDPKHNVTFSAYSTHCIVSEIREELRARRLFRIPVWLERLQEDVIMATEELARENSELPTLQEIADKVNITEAGVAETMQAGFVAYKNLDFSVIKSLRHETFKLPIEDVVKIRKSLDRLSDIQSRVLSLFSDNLRELKLAMEEEELELSREQAQYLRMIENGVGNPGPETIKSFKLDFPGEYDEDEITRYFEVLADEFGLRLLEINYNGWTVNNGESKFNIPIGIFFEGRYRGLLNLLDHLRQKEKAISVERVLTSRNENIPARIRISMNIAADFDQIKQA